MSYTLSVVGEGFSQEYEFSGSLDSSLSQEGAKFANYGFGKFLQEFAGLTFKETPAGTYSWMLYKLEKSSLELADVGIRDYVPEDGEALLLVYQFFPKSNPKEESFIYTSIFKKEAHQEELDYGQRQVVKYEVLDFDFEESVEEESAEGIQVFELKDVEIPEYISSKPASKKLNFVEKIKTYSINFNPSSFKLPVFFFEKTNLRDIEGFLSNILLLRVEKPNKLLNPPLKA